MRRPRPVGRRSPRRRAARRRRSRSWSARESCLGRYASARLTSGATRSRKSSSWRSSSASGQTKTRSAPARAYAARRSAQRSAGPIGSAARAAVSTVRPRPGRARVEDALLLAASLGHVEPLVAMALGRLGRVRASAGAEPLRRRVVGRRRSSRRRGGRRGAGRRATPAGDPQRRALRADGARLELAVGPAGRGAPRRAASKSCQRSAKGSRRRRSRARRSRARRRRSAGPRRGRRGRPGSWPSGARRG